MFLVTADPVTRTHTMREWKPREPTVSVKEDDLSSDPVSKLAETLVELEKAVREGDSSTFKCDIAPLVPSKSSLTLAPYLTSPPNVSKGPDASNIWESVMTSGERAVEDGAERISRFVLGADMSVEKVCTQKRE